MQSLYYLSVVAILFLSGALVSFADSTTIVNTVSVHSSTGGISVAGQAGADGLPGKPGKAGTGAVTPATSMSARTVINGEIVVDMATSTVVNSQVLTNITSPQQATTSNHSETVEALLNQIILILKSYVTTLF